jgi:hypothetical protein
MVDDIVNPGFKYTLSWPENLKNRIRIILDNAYTMRYHVAVTEMECMRVLVARVDEELIERLRQRAKAHERSMAAELRVILRKTLANERERSRKPARR